MPRSGKLTLKAISDRKFGNLTMIGNQWGYYVRATRGGGLYDAANRWACGFSTYDAARLAGKLALASFVEKLELEKSRIEWKRAD
jgi:hypothetical protein